MVAGSPLRFNESTINGTECASIIIIDDAVYETTDEIFYINLQPSLDVNITFLNTVLTLIIVDDDREIFLHIHVVLL